VQAVWTPAVVTRPWGEVAFQAAAAQHHLSPDDVADAFIGPNGTAAWRVLSVRGGATLLSHLRVRAAVENLTNEAYRLHGSQIDRPGREVVLGAEIGF
jgi:outer membrane receptor protein involved in Fe transport